VIEEPEAADGVKTQPVAVPALLKSSLPTPLTDSEKPSGNESAALLEGLEGAEPQVALGVVRSIRTREAVAAEEGPLFAALSLTARAAKRTTTVPSEQEAIVTAIDDPEAAEGVKTQPVAVPVLLKSAEVRPLTASEKVRV
jgi:hypothetical protein